MMKIVIEILVSTAVHSKLKKITDSYLINELGGVLLGRENSKIYIEELIEDSTSEDRSPVHFVRNIQGIWESINIYAKENYPNDYIGEWHTHPEGFTNPSIIDDYQMFSIIDSPYFGFIRKAVLLIATNSELNFWIYSKNKKEKIPNDKVIMID